MSRRARARPASALRPVAQPRCLRQSRHEVCRRRQTRSRRASTRCRRRGRLQLILCVLLLPLLPLLLPELGLTPCAPTASLLIPSARGHRRRLALTHRLARARPSLANRIAFSLTLASSPRSATRPAVSLALPRGNLSSRPSALALPRRSGCARSGRLPRARPPCAFVGAAAAAATQYSAAGLPAPDADADAAARPSRTELAHPPCSHRRRRQDAVAVQEGQGAPALVRARHRLQAVAHEHDAAPECAAGGAAFVDRARCEEPASDVGGQGRRRRRRDALARRAFDAAAVGALDEGGSGAGVCAGAQLDRARRRPGGAEQAQGQARARRLAGGRRPACSGEGQDRGRAG